MESAIYHILDEKDREHIGSAVNFTKKKGAHLTLLRNNRHYNPKLQNAFNKYGEGFFVFEPIVYCEKEDLLGTEQVLIDNLELHYNIAKCTTAPMMGRKHTKEAIAKSTKRGKDHSWLGRAHTDETKAKAARESGVSASCITCVCRGKVISSGGFGLRYIT